MRSEDEDAGTQPSDGGAALMLSIVEVAEALGVPVPTIRSWERRYGLVAPRRTVGGHRRYSDSDVERVRVFRDEIMRGLRPKEVARRIGVAAPLADEQAPERLVRAAHALDEAAIRGALDTAVAEFGIEHALEQVALPALRRIGDHWRSGGCGTQHEHLATHEIRAWIARMISLAPAPFRGGSILLATGPDDHHSVGLEGFGLVMARRGWGCIVLGPRTPTDALVEAIRQRRPAAVVLSAQWTRARRSAVDALRKAARADVPLFYAGAAFVATQHRQGVPGTYLCDRLTDAAVELEQGLGARPRPSRPTAW